MPVETTVLQAGEGKTLSMPGAWQPIRQSATPRAVTALARGAPCGVERYFEEPAEILAKPVQRDVSSFGGGTWEIRSPRGDFTGHLARFFAAAAGSK